jgi:hypothetical protein
LDPQSARIEDEIGFLLGVLQRPDEATRHFERQLQLDSQLAAAQYHIGVAYWIQSGTGRSIPHLQSAVALDRGNFDYRFHLAHATRPAHTAKRFRTGRPLQK